MIEHKYGSLNSGLYLSDKMIVLLGINEWLVEFDYELMEFKKNV